MLIAVKILNEFAWNVIAVLLNGPTMFSFNPATYQKHFQIIDSRCFAGLLEIPLHLTNKFILTVASSTESHYLSHRYFFLKPCPLFLFFFLVGGGDSTLKFSPSAIFIFLLLVSLFIFKWIFHRVSFIFSIFCYLFVDDVIDEDNDEADWLTGWF